MEDVVLNEEQIWGCLDALDAMKDKGLMDDKRYHMLLALLAAQDLSKVFLESRGRGKLLEGAVPAAVSTNINCTLEPKSLLQLQLQIASYRKLSRNVPVSPAVLSTLRPSCKENITNYTSLTSC